MGTDQTDAGTTDPAGTQAELQPCRYSWRELDREDAADLWAELTDWVAWLRRRYQFGSRIPSCWYRHESVVEELTALMAAHTAAYWCDPGSVDLPREDMTAWHTQWLWPVIERVTRNSDFSTCQAHRCCQSVQVPVTHGGLADYIDADLDTRRGRVQP